MRETGESWTVSLSEVLRDPAGSEVRGAAESSDTDQ